MKQIRTSALVAGMMIAALAAQPALAKKKDKEAEAAAAAAPAGAQLVAGVAVASLDVARANTDAFRVAQQQRPQTYKAQYDQANARGAALEAQLKPMYEKFNADRQSPKSTQALLQAQARTIQEAEAKGKQDIQQALLPIALSEAYVDEQIDAKMDEAVQKAMAGARVTLLLQPGAVLARANSYELTDEIVAELNKLIPNAQLVPPQGWEPREIREARAQQAAQQKAAQGAAAPAAAAPAGTPAPAPRPAGPQPDGR